MGAPTATTQPDLHDDIQQAISLGSRPDWQKVCLTLNGLSMDDMLDQCWHLKTLGRLNDLASFAHRADGVNVPRLRLGIGAIQDQSPGDFDGLLRCVPSDQQRSIKSARLYTQPPALLSPTLWPKYYWSTRSLPAPELRITKSVELGGGDTSDGKNDKKKDDGAHVGLDIATAITANAPRSANPAVYTLTVVYRDFNVKLLTDKLQDDDDEGTEVTLGHEPNISVQLSPDPNSKAVYQAAISLVNIHLKRHYGLFRPDVEFSMSGQVGLTDPGNTLSAGLQAQIELHVTTQISVIAQSGASFSKASPGGPPDYGAAHYGVGNYDVAFTPFMLGIVGHWDPPN